MKITTRHIFNTPDIYFISYDTDTCQTLETYFIGDVDAI